MYLYTYTYTYMYVYRYIGKTLYGTVYTVRAVAVSGEGGKGRRCQEDARAIMCARHNAHRGNLYPFPNRSLRTNFGLNARSLRRPLPRPPKTMGLGRHLDGA